MKVKDIDALRDQISHDQREAFTKHQVWLFASEHNKTVPTFEAIPLSALEELRSAIVEMPCAITSMKEIYVNRDKVLELLDDCLKESTDVNSD